MRVVIIQNQTQFGKYINSHQLPDDTLICIDPVSKLLADEKKN